MERCGKGGVSRGGGREGVVRRGGGGGGGFVEGLMGGGGMSLMGEGGGGNGSTLKTVIFNRWGYTHSILASTNTVLLCLFLCL